MTFVGKLSVVTAYLAFAFVGAIVLGVILAPSAQPAWRSSPGLLPEQIARAGSSRRNATQIHRGW